MNNSSNNTRTVALHDLPIELFKLLKLENMVQSGGEAKLVISEGLVSVNGEVEKRKRKKIFAGDYVSFDNLTVCVAASDQ